MLISLNEIKKYVKIPAEVSSQELIDLIGSRLVEVEGVVDLTSKYKGVYIVKVVKCEPIEGTHLNLCQVDAGEHNAEFNQLENGLVQVVCGASNVHAGMLAAWITPGSIVPSTYGNENFKLGVRKLQGYESNGMLAGADELDFDDEHKTIAEIDPKMAQPGDTLADVFELNDIIIDVENKSLTHRPDCFGLIGFAREIAGILGLEFQEPEWPELKTVKNLPISVEITNSDACPRYDCAVFDLPNHGVSKYLTPTAVFLAKAGMRSIDPMVDLTNVIMLQTGQPLHAFDYDKLVAVGGNKDARIIVRQANDSEELQLLDGKVIKCIPEDILITSNNVPVALAGAMGGKNTEVDASTKRVVLESATFSLYNLRKTQMAHGIFSEAITRFTKGQPAAMTLPVLAETIRRLGVDPLAVVDEFPKKVEPVVVKITTDEVNRLLGTNYSTEQITETLQNVGFDVASKSFKASKVLELEIQNSKIPSMIVTTPAWRTDIHIKEDLIEEVGRLLGFDNIPLDLPKRPFAGTEISPVFQLKSELRNILSDNLRMNEFLTYSFVSRALTEKVGLDPEESYAIVNSISPELQCFRQQIAPSLLDKVRENIKNGYRDFTLYEMNQVASKVAGLTDEKTPRLSTDLGIVTLADFYSLKAKLLALFRELRIKLEYAAISSENAKRYPYLEPKRSAELIVNGKNIGAFGELKKAVLRKFKLDDQVIAAAELVLDDLVGVERAIDANLKISRFPFVERDLTLKVASDAPFGRFDGILDSVLKAEKLIYTITPVSIYQAKDTDTTKNISFHLRFSNPERTLDSEAIAAIMNIINVEVTKNGAEII